jgi:predicted DNA-binding protein (UPF0251 family)
MSATSELLIEQIRDLSEKIAKATASGQDTVGLRGQLRDLNEQLQKVTHALNEGKALLKG